jgi:hypothetical protein
MKRMMILPLAILLFACDKPNEKKDDTATTAATSTATPATTATTTTTPANTAAPVVDIAEADLVTPADMQDDAEKAITKQNYKKELASLETEMSKD